jgi:hypothetical protein
MFPASVAVAILVVVLWRLSALAKLTMALFDASLAVISLKGKSMKSVFLFLHSF